MAKKSLVIIAFFIFTGLSSPLSLFSQDGLLDITFSGDGTTTLNIVPSCVTEDAKKVVIQTDGKILVAGNTGLVGATSGYDFAIARYNVDGTLDNTFDGDGKVTTSLGNNERCSDMVLQPDGKIVVVGLTFVGTKAKFAVLRYNSNGSLDTGFDGDGAAITSVGSSDDYAYSVALQANGKIVVAGYSRNGSANDIAVVRYNSDGSLDNTFDGDGMLTSAVGTAGGAANSVVIQGDGKILVGGFCATLNMPSDYVLLRYNSDGSPDNSFDLDGMVITPFGNTNNVQVRSLMIRPDGKIIAAGSCWIPLTENFVMARYNTDGSLDSSFDGDGKLTTGFGNYFQFFSAVLQPDGRIIIGGEVEVNGVTEAVLVRLNQDGTLDNAFQNGGKVITDFGGTTRDAIQSVALQSDGKIVAAGLTYTQFTGTQYFAVARYSGSSVDIRTYDEQIIKVKLYPNPCIANVSLESEERLEDATLTVFNTAGQSVKELKNLSGKKIIFSCDALPAGLYFIHIRDNKKVIRRLEMVIAD